MQGRFTNPWPHARHRFSDVLRWKLGLGPREGGSAAPDVPAPRERLHAAVLAAPPPAGWRAVWLGHSSFLLQGCGLSLLIDPVFSDHCSPLPLRRFRRLVGPPCAVGELPRIDAVLLTHSHYDHLDLDTLRRIGTDTQLLVPKGHAAWLGRCGFRRVVELAWNDAAGLPGGVRVTATPSQHFTARSLFDRDRGHWCGWRIDSPQGSLWHAGDSGYCPAFRETRDRHGPVDFGMIPIGAYRPRWLMRPMHLDPGEAADVFLDTGCRRAVAMHWGTFRLTDEPLGEPPVLLERALEERGIPAGAFVAGVIGRPVAIPGPGVT